MKSDLCARIIYAVALTVALFSCTSASTQEAAAGERFSIYSGVYVLPSGDSLIVESEGEALLIEMPGGNLYRFSDFRTDSRVLAVEQKTRELMDATVAGDRARIAFLFGASSGPMDEYIDSYLEVMSEALAAHPEHSRYEIDATEYRDEDSDYGFGDSGWGWQTYIRFFGTTEDVFARIVWDGLTGNNMHRGIGGSPAVAPRLRFMPRAPRSSWIRTYDPNSATILRVREVEHPGREQMIPARFIAYDVATHHTVGVRFRKDSPDEAMRIEIGPLGSEIQTVGHLANDG